MDKLKIESDGEKKDILRGRSFKTYCFNCEYIIKASEYRGRVHLCSIVGLTSYVGTYAEMQPCSDVNLHGDCEEYKQVKIPEAKPGFIDTVIQWFKE